MSDAAKPRIGSIGWIDLTVDDAEGVRDFWAGVAGWRHSPVEMGGYSDYNMLPPDGGDPVAGVCHARGSNADLPPRWLIYITVEDVDASAARSTELGGRVLLGPRAMGSHGRWCVVEDPAGAVAALFQPAAG